MSEPLVSVIIPVYNREHCVRRAIDSVLAQTFKDYEIVVVDDGSRDGSLAILKTYGDSIRLISQANAGAGTARNNAIRAARGKWIAFLDSDDEWRPEKLALQMKWIAKYGARVCYSRCVAEDGKPLADLEDVQSLPLEPKVFRVPDPVEFFSKARCHPYLQCMVLEKQLFEGAGYFDQSMHTGDDTLWMFKLSFLCDCIYVDEPMTVIYRYSDNSLTYDLRPAQAEKRYNGFIRMQAEMYWRLREARPQQTLVTRGRLGYMLVNRAELACAAGDNRLARELARDGAHFATDRRTFLHGILLWLAPAACRKHFRKKWNYQ